MITSLVSFFGKRDNNILIVDVTKLNLNTKINTELFQNYYGYLKFLLEPLVIPNDCLAKTFKEILDTSDRLVTPVILARTSNRKAQRIVNKRNTTTGGTIDTKNNELFRHYY